MHYKDHQSIQIGQDKRQEEGLGETGTAILSSAGPRRPPKIWLNPKQLLVRLNLFAEGARTELRGIMGKRPPLTPRGNDLAALGTSRGQRDLGTLGTRRDCGS